MLGVDVKDKIVSGRIVPLAAVNLKILNVGFGVITYRTPIAIPAECGTKKYYK